MIKKMKGTYDIVQDIPRFRAVEKAIDTVARLFNLEEIRTPHFEASELFHRSVGEETDIVGKETYDFQDRGHRSITLRPEGTAGVVRAYIENKLHAEAKSPQKYYYYGSMFRYERPQKGRTREFRQFGIEVFGSQEPSVDAEVIACAVFFLRMLKITDFAVHINSLGGDESKKNYEKALKEHIRPHLESLCGDCNRRYEKNPLRILDCKKDADHEALQAAPHPVDALTEEDRAHFESVRTLLDAMDIDHIVDHRLVRGLDYYTHTVFEIKDTLEALGSQDTLCGGGRYDYLVENLGGPSTPAAGFSFGIERLLLTLEALDFTPKKRSLLLYLLAIGEKAREKVPAIAHDLRLQGVTTETDLARRSVKAQFKQSEHAGARFVGIVGDAELEKGVLTLKDQQSGAEEEVPLADVAKTLVERLRKNSSDCETCPERKGE